MGSQSHKMIKIPYIWSDPFGSKMLVNISGKIVAQKLSQKAETLLHIMTIAHSKYYFDFFTQNFAKHYFRNYHRTV